MKIKISYSDSECLVAQAVAVLIQRSIKGIIRKDNEENGTYKHIYLKTSKRTTIDKPRKD